MVAGPESAGAPPSATASMTLLVAAVIVHDVAEDRVLLLQRGPDAAFAPGLWDLPTGKHEPGEPVTATAVRELREETGLVVAPADLAVAHLVHGARAVGSPGGYLTVVFAARRFAGRAANREPHKHARVEWTSTDALPSEFVPSAGEALASYLAARSGGAPARAGLTLRGWA
ncbi:NUDIX domain-containing protein [Actinacidiphila yeochonensis]|uniref:NUDIX domain-containing protein n=1 Tax=Actinacidiphila yeochonensis TaxID=89050 RepID=UPI000AFAA1AF|nr:NUDIX domain-containing protein [Actinacidiphila yeochonensis]